MNPSMPTARSMGLLGCHVCGLLMQAPGGDAHQSLLCPRCQARVHARKPDTLSRTWALLVAAIILYIPANVFPVMTVIKMGRGVPDTILSGVQHLFESGMWFLALVVFVASIVVPVMKIGVLIYLLISVQIGSESRCRDRTQMYRILELFGHWSMVDVFIVSILTTLVNFGAIATIRPGLGISFFAVVVVLTLFAARSFDPRLIWDAENKEQS